MKITVECGCHVAYEFEIEPVEGRMPTSVLCPTCGADGTEYANWVIQTQPAALPPTAAPAAPSMPSGLRVCLKHNRQPFVEHCFFCKKPICPRCMEKFGYFCSLTCRRRAEEQGLKIPVYEKQESVIQAQSVRKAWMGILGVLVLVLVLGTTWAWYSFYASRPSLAWSLPLTAEGSVAAGFIGRDRILVMRSDKLTMYNSRNGKELWSRPLPAPLAPVRYGFDGGAAVHLHGEDLWIALRDRIVRWHARSGEEMKSWPVNGVITEFIPSGEAIIIQSVDSSRMNVFTRIALASGETETAKVSRPEEARLPLDLSGAPPPVSESFEDQMVDMLEMQNDTGSYLQDLQSRVPSFSQHHVPAGANILQMDVRLLEARFTARDTVKAPEKNWDGKDVGMANAMEFAQDLMNDMQRGGGFAKQIEDESRYSLTLRRLLANAVPEWTGEIVGPPALFALDTVDLLVAGKTLHAFDKRNTHLWQAQLTFNIGAGFSTGFGDAGAIPCIEREGALYFFDQGVLTAFDSRTGQVRWRIPSVGISRVQADDSGMLYVTTTSAGIDSVEFPDQVNLSERVSQIIIKVDPKSGKILWKIPQTGNTCLLSGKYLYITRSQISPHQMIGNILGGGGGDLPVHFRIYRHDPSNGKLIWEYYREGPPIAVDAQGNRLLLTFPKELQVLRFFSL